MPARLLREGILDSEPVCSLTFPAEVFYRRLMSVVDDFGRYDGRPSVLRSRLYPLQIDKVREADITRWMAECRKAGLIALYSVSGKQYILFHKLGSPRNKDSTWPPPTDGIGEHLRADENGCAQLLSVAPGAGSGADASTGTGEEPPTPPAGGGRRASKRDAEAGYAHPLFAGFWEAYPKKVAKPDAYRAFAKLNPGEGLFSVMLAALEAFRASWEWTKEGGQYVPRPSAWLDKRRWEDNPLPSPHMGRAPATGRQSTGATLDDYAAEQAASIFEPPEGGSRE